MPPYLTDFDAYLLLKFRIDDRKMKRMTLQLSDDAVSQELVGSSASHETLCYRFLFPPQ